jgi:site-specific DNA-cytosine methylase
VGGGTGAKTGLYAVLEDFYPGRVRAYGGAAPALREGRHGLKVYENPSGTRTLHPNAPEVGEARRLYDPSGVSPPVKESGVRVVGNIYPSGGQAGRVVDAGGLYPTVEQGRRGGRAAMPPVAIYRHPVNYGKKSVYLPDEIHPSLRTVSRPPRVANAVDCGGYLREPGHHDSLATCRIRRLTPVECERLQGFPDGWTERGADEKGNVAEISDTQRYRMMGNAVTVPVAEALGRSINAYMRVLGWA